MGIPGLTAALLPYYTEVQLGCCSAECKEKRRQSNDPLVSQGLSNLLASGHSATAGDGAVSPNDPGYSNPGDVKSPESRPMVIDGPSLVHYIYQCLPVAHTYQPTVPKGVGRWSPQPTYEDVAEGVVAFLDSLKESGIEITAIFFDALLPHAKRGERLKRLETAARLLERLKRTHPSGFAPPVVGGHFDSHSYSYGSPQHFASSYGSTPPKAALDVSPLFNPGAVDGSSKTRGAWPNAPFIVVAVLDKLLRHSTYQNITHMVPGEADLFCAACAHQNDGSIVLSSDSDLFVHDMGPSGAFAYLGSLSSCNCSVCGSQLTGMSVRVWQRPEIERRLNTPSLLRVAFAMKSIKKLSLGEAVQMSKEELDQDGKENFAKFQRLYATEDVFERAEKLPQLKGLDTRVAEFAMQVECPDLESKADIEAKTGMGVQLEAVMEVDSDSEATCSAIKEEDGEEEEEAAVVTRDSDSGWGADPMEVDVGPDSVMESETETGLILSTRPIRKRYDIHMYLPPLHEDAGRAAAWKVGQDLRDIGYGVLLQTRWQSSVLGRDPASSIHFPPVYEFARSGGSRIAARLIPVPSLKTLENWAERMCASLDNACTELLVIANSKPDLWRMIGLCEVRKWYRESGRQAPTAAALARVLVGPAGLGKLDVAGQGGAVGFGGPNGRGDGAWTSGSGVRYGFGSRGSPASNGTSAPHVWTWSDVHLAAQLEAALYSLRVLQQLLIQANVGEGTLGQLRLNVSGLPDFLALVGPTTDVAIVEKAVALVVQMTGGEGDGGEESGGEEEKEGAAVKNLAMLGLDGVDEREGKLTDEKETGSESETSALYGDMEKQRRLAGEMRDGNMYDVLALVDA